MLGDRWPQTCKSPSAFKNDAKPRFNSRLSWEIAELSQSRKKKKRRPKKNMAVEIWLLQHLGVWLSLLQQSSVDAEKNGRYQSTLQFASIQTHNQGKGVEVIKEVLFFEKERKLKNQLRRENCILKKLRQCREDDEEEDHVLYFFLSSRYEISVKGLTNV
ncbi:hypothetical protein Tco_0418126 [Tanacetum coccineum]